MTVRIKRSSPGIRALTELFELLEKSRPDDSYVNLYRGHPSKTYVLQPSIFRRKEYRRVEKNILRELIAIQPKEFREDKTAFEQLVRMQHYGLPTRLLDLTYNPLVGLYFACSMHADKDGEFLTFSLQKSEIKYFDSDTVSCVANLSNLTGRQRDEIRKFSTTSELNESDVGLRLLHFIKAEKPYFLPRIEMQDLKSIRAVRPKQTNQRILAQQGAFLIFGLVSTLQDSNNFGIRVTRKAIPAGAKKKLLEELDSININASTLFPEIDSAAKYIMSKITPLNDVDERAD
ncbi:FRG domain-containing protein [Hypericibacter terrae]|uniref:FRG domain-containing protein n=1 Tax=Hypericibacter terrae TaxID=2602015 RepID=UPI0012456FC1|nr:FRG domain-containing protein [Hypericibacter terrae]